MSYIYDGFFPEFNYIHPFQILIFSPLLLPTDYKLHIQGIFFSRKKGDHTRQTEKTQGKEKNCPKNIVRPGAIKFGAIVPTSRRVSPFMPLVNQASPILAPIKGFFSFLVQKIIGSRDLAVFFLEKKIQSLSNTVFSYIYLKLPHYFRIDTITVWGEACGGKRGRRGDSLFRNKMFVFDGIVQRNFKTLLYFNYIF